MRNLILLFLSSLLFTACAVDPDGYLKRSANNKLIDSKGFDGGKRRPIYNKKYISNAKRNIIENNILVDNQEYEDDLSELEDTYAHNREMYLRMIEQDIERNGQKESKQNGVFSRFLPNKPASSTTFIAKREEVSSSELQETKEELLKEIAEVKVLLAEARSSLQNKTQNNRNIKVETNGKEKVAAKKTVEKGKPARKERAVAQLNRDKKQVDKIAAIKMSPSNNRGKQVAKPHAQKPQALPKSKGMAARKPNVTSKKIAYKKPLPPVNTNKELDSLEEKLELTLNEGNKMLKGRSKLAKKDSDKKIQPLTLKKDKAIANKRITNNKKLTDSASKTITKEVALKGKEQHKTAKAAVTSNKKRALANKPQAQKPNRKVTSKVNQKVKEKKAAVVDPLENLPWLDEDIVSITPTNEIIITKKPRG